MTGRSRRLSGLQAPAVTGHEGFERMHRVQMDTLEMIVAFLPALFLAAPYWPAWQVAGLGAVYVVGRFLYWQACIVEPASRGTGPMLSMPPTLILLLLALAGMVQVGL